ncbi:MAG: gluconate 2-dehydrogenase subunit 3 family protein [Bryobacterales bacterium]|nr:gluconate 2-dehydrogenase subunit 3 family protein [Bryobacterales bacterium]
MKRRTVLKLVAAGVAAERVQVAGRQLVALAQAPAGYKLRFFNDEQNALLDRLTELIIPADDHSPGAHAAKVSLFIDLMVSHSKPDVQDQWTRGLRALENESRERFRKPFLECDAAWQDQIMQTISRNEDHPSTELEKFFRILKSRTIDGYYTSEIGIHQELKYQGNRPQAEFAGCTHPEHGA